MKKLFALVIAAWAWTGAAFAQSSPNLTFGQVLTPAQWNQLFINKQDTLGYTPLNTNGGQMLGRLVTTPSTSTQAGFNIPAGTAPGTPVNGDLWGTTAGLFYQVNGVTIPLTGAGSGSFTASNPLAVTFPSVGVVNYALNFNSSLVLDGGNALGINLTHSNAFTAAQSIAWNSATALCVGPNGCTNPTLQVDDSATSQATGVRIGGAAAGSGVGINAISSATNENFGFNAKGSGIAVIGGVSTGGVDLAGGGGTVTAHGGLTIAGPSFDIFSAQLVGFATPGGAATQGINAASFCADTTFANCSSTPTNGLQVLGGSILKGAVSLTGLGSSGTCANSLVLTSAGVGFLGACPGAAASIQQGVTTITSASGSGEILTTGTVSGGTGLLTNVTVASLFTAGNGISLSGSGNVTINQALTNATLQATPANPTATISTSPVMMGLGGTCHLTPTYSGRIHLNINGNLSNSAPNVVTTATLRFGTSTAPANGVTASGTQIGNSRTTTAISGVSVVFDSAGLNGNITGLTPGTAYWFDLGVSTSNAGGTASVTNVDCNAFEY